MVFIGQNDCYGDGHEVLANLLGVSVGAMQLYRVTDCYGSLLEQEKVFEIDAVTPDKLHLYKFNSNPSFWSWAPR